jgi:phosphatidylethanolamine-binding protein (PEBP) family uncharacterized protein
MTYLRMRRAIATTNDPIQPHVRHIELSACLTATAESVTGVMRQRLSFPLQAQDPPEVQVVGSKGLYTLTSSDPDAPSPQDPKFAEFLHWWVCAF